jgi:hypothetical protein
MLSYSLLKLINTSSTSVAALMRVLLTPIIWMIFGIVSAIFARTGVNVKSPTLLKVVLILKLLIIATLAVKVV